MTKPTAEVGVYLAIHLTTHIYTHSGSIYLFLYTEDDVLTIIHTKRREPHTTVHTHTHAVNMNMNCHISHGIVGKHGVEGANEREYEYEAGRKSEPCCAAQDLKCLSKF